MDKLAYHFNKKKIPAETEGKYLYYYPCDDLENATVRMGKDGYIVIEVTEKEWEALFELDRIIITTNINTFAILLLSPMTKKTSFPYTKFRFRASFRRSLS